MTHLSDTLEGELLLLDEDADGVAHEAGGDLEHLRRHGGGEEHHLDVGVEVAEDVVDLVLEAARQHLVGLVQHEHLDVVRAQDLARDHVEHATGGAWKDTETKEWSKMNQLYSLAYRRKYNKLQFQRARELKSFRYV